MPKIGSNFDKKRFELLYTQIAEAGEGFSVREIRLQVEKALEAIDDRYLDAIESILLGDDEKTADIGDYFDTDNDLLAEEDKTLGEKSMVNVVSFLNSIANGKYTLLNREKEEEKERSTSAGSSEKTEEKEQEEPAATQTTDVSSDAPEEEKEEKEAEDIPNPKYFLNDEEFAKIFLEDRVVDEIGRRYERPLFHDFANRVIAAAEGVDKSNLFEKFQNTYEKIPTAYYEFLEKVVIGVDGVREDPRQYIDMTDDAYEKFFSFTRKNPDAPLTSKDAKKIMNVLANLVDGSIELHARAVENGPLYHKARLPEIAERESVRREEEERSAVAVLQKKREAGDRVFADFMEEHAHLESETAKRYAELKKHTPSKKTAEQKAQLEAAKSEKRRARHKGEVLTENKKLYDKENKKLNKANDAMREARGKLEIMMRKRELLGEDLSKADRVKLGKLEKDYIKADKKLQLTKEELLKKTDARTKGGKDAFPEHTDMRRAQIHSGQTHFIPLTSQDETKRAYAETTRRLSEEAKQSFLANHKPRYEIENENLGAAIKSVIDARAKILELQAGQVEKGMPGYKESLMQRKTAVKEAQAATSSLKTLRERLIKDTIERAERMGDPYPEHTAMRCEQIRTGRLNFTPLATKEETIRANPQLGEKTKQMILNAKAEPYAKTDAEREIEASQITKEAEAETPTRVETKPNIEVKRTPVKFPEGAIPSTTLYDPMKKENLEKIQEIQLTQEKKTQEPLRQGASQQIQKEPEPMVAN